MFTGDSCHNLNEIVIFPHSIIFAIFKLYFFWDFLKWDILHITFEGGRSGEMKQWSIVILAIACAAVLWLGNQQWKEKVLVKSDPATGATRATVSTAGTTEQLPDHEQDLSAYTRNWPEAAQTLFKRTVAEERSFKILLAGSKALGENDTGWANLLATELDQTYGDAVDVSVKSYDSTSLEFIQANKQAELAAEQADLVLLEPFILMNNGEVDNDQAAEHYSLIIAAIHTAKPDAVVLLQPANPLSNARFYPLQVEALKAYADANGLDYLDHWQAWPESEAERLQLLAGGDPSFPNEAGHKLWADYLIDYFIAN
ncbi:SGNH/GDSL hydrolase family protein [Mesobacillus stamsii]|uniref:SGNH hydrolase-type esterase domain-containing protein n=1 Tax=Mesobacillus stamsii TaxID=225347 RepID=A0ABU0FV93_9BACI|nr:SGNH/GDSL hydrolase family protein [Mesobacillus stamsii]MDQ0413823.1 hypothetical protein [Mesobacillus stamsii]